MRIPIFLFALLVTFSLSSNAQEGRQDKILSAENESDSRLIPTQTIDSTGDSALLEVKKGNSYFKERNYAEAVASYKRALEHNPDKHSAIYNLGIANLDWGRFEAAAAAFKRALDLKEDYVTYKHLGVVQQRLKRPQAAIESYKMALKLNPECALSNNNMGFAYLDLKRNEEAALFFRTALRLNPSLSESTQGLCVALAPLQPSLEALEICTNAVATEPDSDIYQYLLGYVYFTLDHFKEAIESFNLAARINPDNPLTHNGLGHSYIRLGQYKEALAHLLRATEGQPDLSDAHAGLGQVYYRMRKPQEATKSLRKAVELDPDSAEAKYNLAIACLTINKRECALEQYNRLKIDAPEISMNLFRILFQKRVLDARQPSKQ